MKPADRVLLMAAGAVNKATPASRREGGPQGQAEGQPLQSRLQAGKGVPWACFTHNASSASIALIFPDDTQADENESNASWFLISNAM